MLISLLIFLPLLGVLTILVYSMNYSANKAKIITDKTTENQAEQSEPESFLKISALSITLLDLFVSLVI